VIKKSISLNTARHCCAVSVMVIVIVIIIGTETVIGIGMMKQVAMHATRLMGDRGMKGSVGCRVLGGGCRV